MTRVRFNGMGPDDASFVGVVADNADTKSVGLQLRGARFSFPPQLAREFATALVNAADAIEQPGGLVGLPVLDADVATKGAIDAAIHATRSRRVQ